MSVHTYQCIVVNCSCFVLLVLLFNCCSSSYQCCCFLLVLFIVNRFRPDCLCLGSTVRGYQDVHFQRVHLQVRWCTIQNTNTSTNANTSMNTNANRTVCTCTGVMWIQSSCSWVKFIKLITCPYNSVVRGFELCIAFCIVHFVFWIL